MICRRVSLISLLLVACATAQTPAASSAPAPVLLELFTSEGCSSCPPADALLERLDSQQPFPGVRLIVMSEHVDYWNHDGWVDPFSTVDSTARQQAYDDRLKVPDPYTPELIVDGIHECVGSSTEKVKAAILDAARNPKLSVRIVPARRPGFLSVEVDASTLERPADVYTAFADESKESSVLRGENQGRSLRHVAVVRKVKKLGKLGARSSFHADVSVARATGQRLVVFVQESGTGPILGAGMQKIPAAASTSASAAGPTPDWNPQLAADYLDAREQAWFEWPAAKRTGGLCVSCHTNAPYLLARPALRRILGESRPTRWEVELRNALQARAGMAATGQMKPLPLQSADAVFAALFLPADSKETFDRLWALQLADGDNRGAWRWLSLNLEPYETARPAFFGAALAAIAFGNAPPEYRRRPDVQPHLADLCAYFERHRDSQPLHNRLVLLWASTRLPGMMPESERRSLIDETSQRQSPDGGWSLQSLGPWKTQARIPDPAVSNSYATALVACALRQAGVSPSDARLARALSWLRAHQDKQGGYWEAESMNKVYPAGSMQENFMRDAATSFAVLALAGVAAPPELQTEPRRDPAILGML